MAKGEQISYFYSSYLLISKAHVGSSVGAIYQSTSREMQPYFLLCDGAVQQDPVVLQKMQTSNGYAILSCTGNVKAMDRRLRKSLFFMVYTFTSYVISTLSIIQATNTIADRMRPMISIELLLSRVCRHTKVPKPFQLEMHIIYGVTNNTRKFS